MTSRRTAASPRSVVNDGYVGWVMLIIVAIGMVAGAIGSGIAASRFLDV